MNLRIFEERAIRSKSPKRYSLNRKIKWKERKQFTDFIEAQKSPSLSPFSFRETAKNDRSGKELPSYEMWKRDCRGMENLQVSSPLQVPASQDDRVCLSSPVTEMKTPRLLYTPSDMQHSIPVSQPPGVNTSPIVPCSSTDFRIIARPVKRQPQNQLYRQAIDPSCNASQTQHYGNFQGMQYLQTPHLLYNGTGVMSTSCSAIQWNSHQESPFVQTYMMPIQSSGFQLNPINNQRNSEAYNAFTAYGNPFGVFWSQQN